MRYWLDTEFHEDGRTIELISIGIVAEDGREYYAVSADYDYTKANAWLKKNVIPHLDMSLAIPRSRIRDEVLQFVGHYQYDHDTGRRRPHEFWAYYADYDWVVLCQLFGRMVDLPHGWPMYCRDVKQWCDMLGNPKLPEQERDKHHALADAKWNKATWDFLDQFARSEKDELRAALNHIGQVLGSAACTANQCEGCQHEMETAADVATRALEGKTDFVVKRTGGSSK